jgi:predicted Zn-dependent protease
MMAARLRRVTLGVLAWALVQAPAGCAPGGIAGDEGPGHRSQVLALSPAQELELGRAAYREILAKLDVLPSDHPAVERVDRVGGRIVAATRIRPLLREINLHEDGDRFEWEFNVIDSGRVNAFSLPAGKVVVFTGLLQFVRDDDELATILGHEMAHALAHHASERLAINPGDVAGLVGAGSVLQSLSYGRFQEMEADHIGVFLMTFAGYDPQAALTFWERMRQASSESIQLPEILSDHPTDARRLAQLQAWVPLARGGKRAFDRGDIVSGPAR